jgi:tRNA pseudouridine55 synthase
VGCGAHLEQLRRTAVAEFTIDDALSLDQLTRAATSGGDFFVHPRKLLPRIPSVTTDDANAARIRSGRPVNLPELSRARQVKVFYGQSQLIAIATRVAGTLFHAKLVLSGESAPITR